MFRKFALLISICTLFLQGFSQDFSYREIDLNHYLGSKTLDEYNIRIYNAALSGKIPAYKTDSLKKVYTAFDLKMIGGEEVAIEVCPDPEYPDYCYDSTIINPFYEGDISGNYISEKWIFISKKNITKTDFYALALLFNWTIAGQDLGKQPLFWIDILDLEKVFSTTELHQIKQAIFKENQYVYSDSLHFGNITERVIDLRDYVGLYTLKDLNQKIYNHSIEGRAKTYTSIYLDSIYSLNQASRRGERKEVVEICPDPDYPDYCYDSIVYNPILSDEIILNYASEILYEDYKDFSYHTKLNAFALAEWYSKDQPRNLFWISYKDLKKILTKDELVIVIHGIYKATVDQHHMYKRD